MNESGMIGAAHISAGRGGAGQGQNSAGRGGAEVKIRGAAQKSA